MPRLIDGTRIGQIIRDAHQDPELRIRLFHCPEKAIDSMGLTPEESSALRTGDLSRVDLDDETLAAGRRLFDEMPTIDEASQSAAAYLGAFRPDAVRELCT